MANRLCEKEHSRTTPGLLWAQLAGQLWGGDVSGGDEQRGAQEFHTWEAVPQLSPQTRAGACRRLLVPPLLDV